MNIKISYNDNFKEAPGSVEIYELSTSHCRVSISKYQDKFGVVIKPILNTEAFKEPIYAGNPVILLPHECYTKEEYYKWLDGFVNSISVNDLCIYVNNPYMWNGVKHD